MKSDSKKKNIENKPYNIEHATNDQKLKGRFRTHETDDDLARTQFALEQTQFFFFLLISLSLFCRDTDDSSQLQRQQHYPCR